MEGQTLLPTKTIKVLIGDGRQQVQMSLRGIIYYVNGNHFVSRIVTANRDVWFNDGMANNAISRYEDKLTNMSLQTLSCAPDTGGQAIAMVYTRQ